MKGSQAAYKSGGQFFMTIDDFWATPPSMWRNLDVQRILQFEHLPKHLPEHLPEHLPPLISGRC